MLRHHCLCAAALTGKLVKGAAQQELQTPSWSAAEALMASQAEVLAAQLPMASWTPQQPA